MPRQFFQARHDLGTFDKPANTGDFGGVLLDQRRLIGLAALAGPEARALGVATVCVEPNVLGPGSACRARRTAVHPGGLDRVHKFAVRQRVTGDDRRPSRVIHRCGRQNFLVRHDVHFSSLSAIH